MNYRLKNDDGIYLKEIDTQNSKLEFTRSLSESKTYGLGEWYANNELDFIKFHFKDLEELKTMKCVVE